MEILFYLTARIKINRKDGPSVLIICHEIGGYFLIHQPPVLWDIFLVSACGLLLNLSLRVEICDYCAVWGILWYSSLRFGQD